MCVILKIAIFKHFELTHLLSTPIILSISYITSVKDVSNLKLPRARSAQGL